MDKLGKYILVTAVVGLVLWMIVQLFVWAAVEAFGTSLPNGATAIVVKDIHVPSWNGDSSSCTIAKGAIATIGGITTAETGSSDVRVRFIDSKGCSGWPADDLGLKKSLDLRP